jgi:hypothetical protein
MGFLVYKWHWGRFFFVYFRHYSTKAPYSLNLSPTLYYVVYLSSSERYLKHTQIRNYYFFLPCFLLFFSLVPVSFICFVYSLLFYCLFCSVLMSCLHLQGWNIHVFFVPVHKFSLHGISCSGPVFCLIRCGIWLAVVFFVIFLYNSSFPFSPEEMHILCSSSLRSHLLPLI